MIEMLKGYLPEMLDNLPLFPPQASTMAAEVDVLTFVWTAISLVSTVIIVAAIAFFMVRYRRRSVDELGGGELHAPMVEVISMAIPFVVCMAMFVWGAKVFIDLERPPKNAVEYLAFGKQWMWKYQHPNGLREINNLTVPVDTAIKMTMTSEDVIHSFFVPAFRVKQDVLPGRYTTVWFEATQIGVFRMFCAEYCGSEHSLMGGTVTVLPRREYDAWLREEEPERADPVSSGEQLFTSLSCTTCHTGDSPRGPALHDLFGSEVKLASGMSVTADETYIRESIVNPRGQIKEGYAALMPTFEGQVSEEQLSDLIAYIKTLDAEPVVTNESAETELAQLEPSKLNTDDGELAQQVSSRQPLRADEGVPNSTKPTVAAPSLVSAAMAGGQ